MMRRFLLKYPRIVAGSEVQNIGFALRPILAHSYSSFLSSIGKIVKTLRLSTWARIWLWGDVPCALGAASCVVFHLEWQRAKTTLLTWLCYRTRKEITHTVRPLLNNARRYAWSLIKQSIFWQRGSAVSLSEKGTGRPCGAPTNVLGKNEAQPIAAALNLTVDLNLQLINTMPIARNSTRLISARVIYSTLMRPIWITRFYL